MTKAVEDLELIKRLAIRLAAAIQNGGFVADRVVFDWELSMYAEPARLAEIVLRDFCITSDSLLAAIDADYRKQSSGDSNE
jgi:hypothetical protein